MFAPDELIAALADAGVEYVLIGGLAVGAHGYPRATKDVDIVPGPEPANLERLAALLRALDAQHYGLGDFDPSEFPFDPHNAAERAEGRNFALSTRLGRLDVMQWVPGIPGERAFEHLARGAVGTELNGRPVRVCSRGDLIAMKRAAGRPQDLVDLEELRAEPRTGDLN
jgi:hypothetical protein